MGASNDEDDEAERKYDTLQKVQEIERLKAEAAEMKRTHQNEKTTLLQSIQRLSSQSAANHQNGSDMGMLVNSLSTLIQEKEEIIESLSQSKKFLGLRLLELEKQLKQSKK